MKNPETQKKALEKIVEMTKGGRTRSDELLFIASLISLSGPDATLENKQLFLQKHYELCELNLIGKTPEEIKELQRKKKLAEGLIFLIAEDKTANDKKNLFKFANQIWHGIFMGINELTDDANKMRVLEQRILHFGKNHQEKMTSQEIIEKIKPVWNEIDSAAGQLADVVGSVSGWAKRQTRERVQRVNDRKQMTAKQRLHPANLWRAFLDQF
jgi:hypothetical protein